MFANVTLSLMGGFVTTVQLFCLTLVFALPLGLLISFGSMSRITPLRALIKIIVWIVRGTPLMLQLLIIYYGPGILFDNNIWGGGANGRLTAALAAFIINYACYFSEIYRGGIESISKGQIEAGQGLGMTRSQKFFNLMSGRPKTVILDGQIDQNALRTLRLTTADLLEALRGKNIFDPRDVSYAVVETNGSLSAALRPEKETATLADLQLKVEHSHATIPFVLDGQVLEENLHWCGKDRDWLERTAQANTLLPEEILLLVGNETEDYFLLKKESRRKSSSR
mgnify:CR=1 FL=1